MNSMMCALSRRFALTVVASAALVGGVALGGCKRANSDPPGEGKAGTTTTNAATVPAKSAAATVVGKWVSLDGNDTLTITSTTISREYKKVPDAPKVVMPYTVAKDEDGVVTLAPILELPNGKKMKLDAQVFTVVDADTISGGLAKKTPVTFKRSK